ncbi:MAG: UDP-N-acetylmuramate--L-alanine ligase [Patescibacteria group bacterium]
MKIHFVGTGGIGISALASYYLAGKQQVSGSDSQPSEITKALKNEGARIFIGHRAKNVSKKTDLVIYSLAIKKDNTELKRARKLKIKTKSYPEALGELTKDHSTIAVCGVHGKTTATALLALNLIRASFDPIVVIGTKLKEFGDTNFRIGNGRYLIIEADEYKSAFLNYWPKIILLLSIEKEHLDYYKNLRHILDTFEKFVGHLPEDGILVANRDDKNVRKLAEKIRKKRKELKIVFYSLRDREAKKIKGVLKIPGDFNVSNAIGVLKVSRILGVPDKTNLKTFSRYRGAWRRFEIFKESLNAKRYTLVSDYAHHPTQVKLTLKAAREKFPQKRIVLVYQPHQIKRTKNLFGDFVKSFDDVDVLILNEIFKVAGREESGQGKISSKDLALAVFRRWKKLGFRKKLVRFIESQDDIFRGLEHLLQEGDVVIVMGAGDIYKLTLRLRSEKA